jgi:hypothetical protein
VKNGRSAKKSIVRRHGVVLCGGRLLDLLDSGLPLTISAEKGSYALPVVNAPDWRKRFKENC